MNKKLKAVRGMNDILPVDSPYWQRVESVCRQVAMEYSYHEIRTPMVEDTALFKRSIGEVTDIVEKEMYSFEDRNGDSLSLRPEGTASCMRAGIEHSLFYGKMQRLWYLGPMFRRERPQKGRYRQFYQFGIEAVGMPGPEIEAEVILLSRRLWKHLDMLEGLELQLNTLGSPECRARYRELLVAYYKDHLSELDEDSQRRLETNPLRILDSKNPEMKALNANAPQLIESLSDESRQHFERLCELLKLAGVPYVLNPHLVRGLDYYCHTVFEWVTSDLGSQNTVCAGGRYDGLIEQLGDKATPAFGFALGIERLILLLREKQSLSAAATVFMVAVGDEAVARALFIAESLRDAMPTLSVEVNCGGGSFKSQFKRADKSGAHFAAVIGEEELNNKQITLKDLRHGSEQQTLSLDALIEFFKGSKNEL